MEDTEMGENLPGENITRCRKKLGMSQEKVAEYMGVSRQAVTKWENNISMPSSENLIKLAGLFGITVEVLLGKEERKETSDDTKGSADKKSWIFIGISTLCIAVYFIISTILGYFSGGTLICVFIIYCPIQLFLHIYFSNAIRSDSFGSIAGFDEKIEYNKCEVKKLLAQINLHIETMSTVYIFLLCVIGCMNLHIKWMNGLLMAAYIFHFVVSIFVSNYKMIDKIYRNAEDKKRAVRSAPLTAVYIIVLFVGIVITAVIFEMRGIENNTAPALKLSGLLILGMLTATGGFFLESNRIKKWNPAEEEYKMKKINIACLLICVIIYGAMCII